MNRQINICFSFFTAVFHLLNCSAQNLVPNPGFEIYSSCPSNWSTAVQTGFDELFDPIPPWTMPDNGSGTSDWFHRCAAGTVVGVPENSWGHQEPHSGDSYTGMGVFLPNYSEYMQIQLSDTLQAGESYRLSFFVSLAGPSPGLTIDGCNNIGAYFSVDPPTGGGEFNPSTSSAYPYLWSLGLQPQVKTTAIISDSINWTCITGTFIAEGGEQWLTLGNFSQSTTLSPPGGFSYYYVDDVSVERQNSSLTAMTTICDDAVELETVATDASYQWNTGSSSSSITITDPGIYWVDITHECYIRRDSFIVQLVAAVEPEITLVNGEECGDSTLLFCSVPPNSAIIWSTAQTGDTIVIGNSGTYWVEMTTPGCDPRYDSAVVNVLATGNLALVVPNVITPDGDGINEIFHPFPEAYAPVTDYQLLVVNRWGTTVFETTDPKDSWDATKDEQLLPEGVYFYRLQYTSDCGGGLVEMHGFIQCIRK